MDNFIYLSKEVLIRKIGIKARQCRFSDKDPLNIPDEETLCPLNPDYSCVSCNDVDCPDWGTRWASCPEHK